MQDGRIIELEIKLAYQDDLLQALNQIVIQQRQQVDRLEATCELLNEQIKSLSQARPELAGNADAHEIPPHY